MQIVTEAQADQWIEFGRAIRARRQAIGISQEELAHRSRVSLRTVHRIEKGNTSCYLRTLVAIATALELQLDISIS